MKQAFHAVFLWQSTKEHWPELIDTLPASADIVQTQTISVEPRALPYMLGRMYALGGPNFAKAREVGGGRLQAILLRFPKERVVLAQSLSGTTRTDPRLSEWKQTARKMTGVRAGVHTTDTSPHAWMTLAALDPDVFRDGPSDVDSINLPRRLPFSVASRPLSFEKTDALVDILGHLWRSTTLREPRNDGDIDIILRGKAQGLRFWLEPSLEVAAGARQPKSRVGELQRVIDVRQTDDGYLPKPLACALADFATDSLRLEADLYRYFHHKKRAGEPTTKRLRDAHGHRPTMDDRAFASYWTYPRRLDDRTLVVRGAARKRLGFYARLLHHPRYAIRLIPGLVEAQRIRRRIKVLQQEERKFLAAAQD